LPYDRAIGSDRIGRLYDGNVLRNKANILRTLLVSHPSAFEHEMGPGHPEQPDRARVIEAALAEPRFAGLERRTAPAARREEIARAHSQSYLDALEQASPSIGYAALDSDTAMNSSTLAAARFAAGGAVAAVEAVMTGAADNAFVASRPPGHHAGAGSAMGFCFLNNVAVAARSAMATHGAERVAIVDFDVHHGNGTQEIFWDEKNVLFCSTHQAPFYPGTGGFNETGAHDNVLNAPLRAGADGEIFLEALREAILPRLKKFCPDLLLISAGFDAHVADPLGGLRLEVRDFSEATKRLMDLADRCCKGRLVSLLEGGYDLEALPRCVAAHVGALAGW
jgi:acetoin utilization deacetylase AcuC-like enzyme